MPDINVPRISVNKLGEFLVSDSPVRRRAIIRDQKYKNNAAAPRYRNATDPIEAFLVSGGLNINAVLSSIESLRSASGTDWNIDDSNKTADALEAFLDIGDQLPLEDAEFIRGENSPQKLLIAGVEVSIRPDFLVHARRRTTECIGAVKLHYISDDKKQLTTDGGQYITTLLHRWLQQFNPGARQPHHTFCFSVDVFRKAIFVGPASTTARMRDIEAACEEIALRWASI